MRPVRVAWDGGTMHEGEPIDALASQFADRLALERLPPFAPMLNPVEWLWSWLKWERLSNFAPHDVHELDGRVVNLARRTVTTLDGPPATPNPQLP